MKLCKKNLNISKRSSIRRRNSNVGAEYMKYVPRDCMVKAHVLQAMIGTLGFDSSGSTPKPN